jgi:hypothetical protein
MPKSVKVERLDPIPNVLDLDPIPAPLPYTPPRLDPIPQDIVTNADEVAAPSVSE